MELEQIIKVINILDVHFNNAVKNKDIETMKLIVDIKKEVLESVNLPF